MMLYRVLLVSCLLIPFSAQTDETAWQGALQDGSQISIDPITNKVTRTSQGESSQLWDGVHQLDNGAVIIVRDGIVVKDQAILRIQREQDKQQLAEACGMLVRKVCGPRNECDAHPACDPARQLFALEQDEVHKNWSDVLPETSKECLKAMSQEDFFAPCTKRTAGTPLSSCEKLQRRVCGEKNQCADSDACNVANQLVKMEAEDRYTSPGDLSHASRQCSAMQNDKGFFNTCE